jgi:hypothetical protein
MGPRKGFIIRSNMKCAQMGQISIKSLIHLIHSKGGIGRMGAGPCDQFGPFVAQPSQASQHASKQTGDGVSLIFASIYRSYLKINNSTTMNIHLE